MWKRNKWPPSPSGYNIPCIWSEQERREDWSEVQAERKGWVRHPKIFIQSISWLFCILLDHLNIKYATVNILCLLIWLILSIDLTPLILIAQKECLPVPRDFFGSGMYIVQPNTSLLSAVYGYNMVQVSHLNVKGAVVDVLCVVDELKAGFFLWEVVRLHFHQRPVFLEQM